ncbi:MAG: SAM-dependent methyltransferase [Gemmatimonadetes bacterium]|nr:SAM-dependent methyltransferase [Gemmatimonadota bacterium]
MRKMILRRGVDGNRRESAPGIGRSALDPVRRPYRLPAPRRLMPITHVSDTARWVAIDRVQESERPDAPFHDPHARRLAGEHGEVITAHVERGRVDHGARVTA